MLLLCHLSLAQKSTEEAVALVEMLDVHEGKMLLGSLPCNLRVDAVEMLSHSWLLSALDDTVCSIDFLKFLGGLYLVNLPP